MDGEIPAWIDKDFIEDIYRKSENDMALQVTNMTVKRATCKGDNYTSDMFRLTVHLIHGRTKQEESKSIIFKLAPTKDGMHKEFVTKMGLFTTEISMMMDTLKKMNNLLGDPRALSAKGVYMHSEHPTFLIVEDLAQFGFRMASRHDGLDLEHSLLAIHGLAKFHASSVALYEKDPSLKSKYYKGMFFAEDDNSMEQLEQFFVSSVQALGDEMKTWPEPTSKYADKVKECAPHILKLGIKYSHLKRENEFNVLNHGDCWVNNMLFKYDDNGKPIRHIFVDFQLCKYASPVLDLHYFFGTSLTNDIYFDKKELLLEEYLKTLSSTMKRLNCQTSPPTMADLNNSLQERNVLGMIASMTVLPVILIDKEDALTVDEMLEMDPINRNPGIKSKRYREIMSRRIPMFDQMGLFDI